MLFPQDDPELDLHVLRTDAAELFGSHSDHPFELDDFTWPTIEHYFQAMKFTDDDYQQKIKQASTPQQATKLGSRWFKRPRKDWKKIQVIVMTRAVYTQAKTHPAIAQALLATAEQKIVENSSYDFYWGCGRDRRGENQYGQVLMAVREKLKQEQSE